MLRRHPLPFVLAAYVAGILLAEELRPLGVALHWAAGVAVCAGAILAAALRWGGAHRLAAERLWEGLPPDLDAAELPPDAARARDRLIARLDRLDRSPMYVAATVVLFGGMLLFGASRTQPALETAALIEQAAATLPLKATWWEGTIAGTERGDDGALFLDVRDARPADASPEGARRPQTPPLPAPLRLTIDPALVTERDALSAGGRVAFRATVRRAIADHDALPGAEHTPRAADLAGRGSTAFRAFVREAGAVRIDASTARGAGAPERLRASLRALLRRAIADPDAAATVRAMCLGDTWGLSQSMRAEYANTGLIHVLSVSGLHASLLAALVLGFARAAGAGPRGAALLAAALLPLYLVVTGYREPIVRASIMTAVFLLPWIVGWNVPTLHSWALAALAILLADPVALYSVSFQLSFLAVLGIFTLASRLDAAFTPARPAGGSMRRHALRWVWRSGIVQPLWVSVGTTLAIAPLLADFNNRIPILGAVGNVVAVPLAAATVALGFVACFVAPFAVGLAESIAAIAGIVAGCQNAVVHAMDAIPGVSLLVAAPGPLACAGYFAILFLPHLPPVRPHFPWTRHLVRGHLLWRAPVALSVLAFSSLAPPPERGAAELIFFDVGQGDATLILMPGGAAILVDGGTRAPDRGRHVIVPYLARRGIRRLDLVVSTHGDADHIGGLISVMRAVPVDRLIEGEVDRGNNLFREYRDASARVVRRESAATGQVYRDSSGAALYVLHPPSPPPDGLDSNDLSAILLFDYGEVEVLLPGDAEEAAEWALATGGWIDALEILKAGHHGSATSGSMPLLRLALPELVVISCGAGNSYGFPAAAAMARYESTGADIRRTDVDGTVRVLIDRDGWRFAPADD